MADEAQLHQVERTLARVLLWGVGASVLGLLSGWILSVNVDSQAFSDDALRSEFLGLGAEFPNTITKISSGLSVHSGASYMMLGLLCLIATPLLRVVFSLGVFVYQRDRVYMTLTAIVLALLALSIGLGQTH